MIERFIAEPLDPKAQALVNKYAGKTLILIAGGRTVWSDFQRFTGNNWSSEWDVMAVNDVGMFYDRHLEHWFSCHGEQLPMWSAVREFHHTAAKHRHSCKDRHHSCVPWPVPVTGTSTLAGVYVGLALGYDRIVLCGAPLDDSGHFFAPLSEKTHFAKSARHDVWERARDTIFGGKVKSMSGYSREMLGEP